MAIPEPRGITIGKGTPQKLEVQNGDMTIRSSIKGLKIYVKESNKWHGIDLDIDLRSLVGTIQRLEKEVKRLSNKTNNTPVVDKILLSQSGGSAAVAMQNKSGNIAFRNSTDSADALINNPKIRGAQDGSDVNPVIDTQASNEVKLAYNDNASHFTTKLIHAATDTYDNRLSFYSGATARWSLGFNADAQTTLKIAQAASLASPVLELDTNGGTNSGVIKIVDAANGNIELTPNGTGEVVVGSGAASGKISSSGAFDLELDTNGGTNSGSIVITDGANGDITIATNGTGAIDLSDDVVKQAQMKDYAETVYANGSKTGAFDLDLTNGNVQSFTVGSGTFNVGITNSLASQSNSLTLIITNGGAGTVTFKAGAHGGGGNSAKWAGGTAPTLTTSGVDVLTFTTFDGGSNFYGFAAGLAMA